MKRKSITLLALFVTLGGIAVGCSPTPAPAPEVVKETVVVEKEVEVTKVVELEKEVVVTATPEPEEKPPWWVPEGEEVTLTYQFCMTEKEAAEREELNRFEATHPRIKVKLDVLPCMDMLPKLTASFAAGNPPDVIAWGRGFVWDYGDEGLLADIGSYVERDMDLDDYYPLATIGTKGDDGTWYGWGRNWVCSVIFYNKDLFDEAGLSYPDENWTWQDYREAAKKLTKDTDGDGEIDQYGAFVAPDHLQLDPIILAFGGRVFDWDDMQVHFSDPKSIEATQFLADMILVDESAPPGQLVQAWSQAREDEFSTGKVGMRINGAWMLGRYSDLTAFRWGMAPLPKGPEGRFVFGGADMFFISQNAVDRGVMEQAWELFRWLMTPDGGVSWYAVSNPAHLPTSKSIAESSEYKALTSGYKEQIDVIKFSAPYLESPTTKYWNEWRSKVNAILNDAFNGVISVEDACKQADAEANAILAQW